MYPVLWHKLEICFWKNPMVLVPYVPKLYYPNMVNVVWLFPGQISCLEWVLLVLVGYKKCTFFKMVLE